MERFIRGQRANLDQVRQWALFTDLVDALDSTYRCMVANLPADGFPTFYGRVILIAHKSLLAASTLIAQGQPEDSTGITRRAIEGAKVALAIKLNDENAQQWLAFQERHERWIKRQQNERPSTFRVQFQDIHGDVTMDRLNAQIGILSDASVHFTLEFYSNLDWQERAVDEQRGEIFLNYFHRDMRELKRQFLALSAAHLVILEALNKSFDGRFADSCREPIGNFVRLGQRFNEEFHNAPARG